MFGQKFGITFKELYGNYFGKNLRTFVFRRKKKTMETADTVVLCGEMKHEVSGLKSFSS